MRKRLQNALTRFVLCVSCLIFAGLMVTGITNPHAAAVAQGDGMMVYGEGTVTTPRTRTWTQATTSWSAEGSGPTAAATIRSVIVKASPKRDEMIAGIQTTGGVLYIQRWNGTAWSNEWNVTVGNGMPRFDIAYERNSGEAVIVYSGNVGTTNELRYRVWSGSAWTAATNLDAVRTSGVIHTLRMESQGVNSDAIGIVWADANLDVSANYWNGATNTWTGEPTAALSTNVAVVGTSTAPTNWAFDVAFEGQSGDMLVVWGNNTVQDLLHITRAAGASGAWGTATTTTAALEEPTDLDLSSDPNSDYIAYANITDNTAGADASTWTGTGWNAFSNFDTAIGTVAATTNNISVSWVRNGTQDRAVIVYEDAAAAGIDWVFYNKNTNAWSAVQTAFTAAPTPVADMKSVRQVTNPFNTAQAMVVVVDSASDVFAKRLTFDGTNFTWSSSEGAAALEISASSITGIGADFDYARYIPGTLTVDIVDASGVSVVSPTVAMNTASVSLNCQSISGVFGAASQKIRVNNGTATPGWTLTVAATAGSTITWSSGTEQYDYNDSSGTPAGCDDGGDADTQAGRLGFNPSTATIDSQSGCTAAGLSLGSAANFAQGTVDNLTLATASSGAGTGCYWDITGIATSQQLPAEKGAGNYTINLTLTVTAN